MKRSLRVLLAALCLASFLAHAAASCPAEPLQTGTDDADTALAIQSIRRQYAAINKRAGKYKKVRKKLSGFSLEGGGELVAYLDGQAVVKIVANHYGEMGQTLEEYYYQQGKLIFVFQKESRYDRPLSGKVVRTLEYRFYFENDRLIRWLDEDGKPVASGSTQYLEEQNEYLETSRKFVNGARSKGSTIEASTRKPHEPRGGGLSVSLGHKHFASNEARTTAHEPPSSSIRQPPCRLPLHAAFRIVGRLGLSRVCAYNLAAQSKGYSSNTHKR